MPCQCWHAKNNLKSPEIAKFYKILRWQRYEVEAILDDKLDDDAGHAFSNRRLFLIKWKDYDHSYDSWEPRENLSCAQEILDAYMLSKRNPPHWTAEPIPMAIGNADDDADADALPSVCMKFKQILQNYWKMYVIS